MILNHLHPHLLQPNLWSLQSLLKGLFFEMSFSEALSSFYIWFICQATSSEGSLALQTIASSVADFGQFVRTSLAPPAPPAPTASSSSSVEGTPQQCCAAIRNIKAKEAWLDLADRVALIELLQKDKTAIDAYAALDDDDELCHEWIKSQLSKGITNGQLLQHRDTLLVHHFKHHNHFLLNQFMSSFT